MDTVGFALNPEPRCACLLVLDVSGSMDGVGTRVWPRQDRGALRGCPSGPRYRRPAGPGGRRWCRHRASCLLTVPQQGEYLNETVFLISDTCLKDAQFAFREGAPDVIALFSDGLQMLALDLKPRPPVPHGPFFDPFFNFVRGQPGAGRRAASLNAFLESERVCARTDDDKTHTLRRNEEHDRFALAVLLFLVLQEGSHPFRGLGPPSELGERIQRGLFPFAPGCQARPPPLALFTELAPALRDLFRAAFATGHVAPG